MTQFILTLDLQVTAINFSILTTRVNSNCCITDSPCGSCIVV